MTGKVFSTASGRDKGYIASVFERTDAALAAFVLLGGVTLGICLIVIWNVIGARHATRLAVETIPNEAVVEKTAAAPKHSRFWKPGDTQRSTAFNGRIPESLTAPQMSALKMPRRVVREPQPWTYAAASRVARVGPRPAPGSDGLFERDAPSGRIEVAHAATGPNTFAIARLIEPEPAPLQIPRAGPASCSPLLAHEVPRRPGGARGGSAVMARIGNGSGSARDNAIVREAVSGNVPDYLRDLRPVTFSGVVGGRRTEITICATPDYLAIGSDGDHVRVPLGMPAALRVAEAFGMMLPTTRMVDAIYAQADLRLSPRPMTPGPQMRSTDYFLRHDATVDAQLARAGGRDGILVAGHKKDLVIANRLSRAPGRVAIYGWHRGNGDPIQPLSTVHGASYADYSHGIRLVSRTAYLNGRATDLASLLTDSRYAGLLNSDGQINAATVRLASL